MNALLTEPRVCSGGCQSSPTVHNNFVWALTGNSGYSACQWLIWVALAKLGSPEMVGQYAFAQAIATPIILFSNLQQRSIQATDVTDGFTFGHHVTLRTASTAAALLLIAA